MDYTSFDAPHVAVNPSPSMGNKIHVLLVEHESIDHDNIINMLRCFSYEVTSVNHASSGLSFLSKEKAQFDLVIANMTSPDSFGYQLLQLALKMNLLVILTSNEDDAVRTMRALEHGAFLCVKKPVTMQVLGYLWQHVSREKMSQMLRQKEASKEVVKYNPQTLEPSMDEKAPDLVPTKRKVWTEWTVELHDKFMKAARYLGPGRCYPKDILDLMNVPGLTRMQVASHLQKCRTAKWLPPNQRKTKQAYEEVDPLQVRPHKRAPRSRPTSFGSMPLLDDDVITQQLPPIQETQNPEIMDLTFNPTVDLGGSNMGYINPTVGGSSMGMGYINPTVEGLSMGMGYINPTGEGSSMGVGYMNPTVEGSSMGMGYMNPTVESSSMGMGLGYINPDQYLLDYGMNEDMGQIGQGFGVDSVAGQTLPPTITDLPLNDVGFGASFGAPFVDPMMGQNFSQPELGFDSSETWESLLLGQEEMVVDLEAPTYVGDGGNQYWAYGGFESGMNDSEGGGQMF